MKNYKTEQKRILLDFLKANSENSYTIDEIISELDAYTIGKSTVYRLMTKLVEEKVVMRSTKENCRQFVYRIIASDHCRYHLHLQCTECGKILHLDEKTSDALLDTVKNVQAFCVSEEDTVLKGRCSQCNLGGAK